jgi:hypothetical protein
MDVNTIEMANSIARAPTKTWIAYLDTCKPPNQNHGCHLLIVRDKANHTTVLSLYLSTEHYNRRKTSPLNMEDLAGKSSGTISVWTNRSKSRSSIPTSYSLHTSPKKYPQGT